MNINGLNSPAKRKKIFHNLQILNADIIAVQEMHINGKQKYLLHDRKLGNAFMSLDKQKKRGVVLYIKDWISAKEIFKDKDGRILMVEIELENKKILLIRNVFSEWSTRTLLSKNVQYNNIKEIHYEEICILGDFNANIDKTMDYKAENKKIIRRKVLPKIFHDLAKEAKIYDAWREHHPSKKRFTSYSNRHQSWSRLDMVWMPKKLISEITEIEIEPSFWADHSYIKFSWKDQSKTPR
uniref:exodeoxyribonuclease III n=1 Tax=Micrurus spixii TaxID=129469 RepID=A0A2D4M5L7_9SAUR